jgi:hypothetical protein
VNEIISFPVSNPVECRYAPYNAKATKVALPIAKPFPIAAVVLPAESKTSVLDRIYYPNSAISAIPPALSLIGPYASIAKQIGRLDSMPIAAKATP